MPTLRVTEAYSILGLEQGCSLDTVKSTYKQIALRTHPDKNPGNPDATAEFQRVSEAYNVLVKHLDPSARPSRGPFDFSAGNGSDDGDYSDDEYGYYDAHMPFYLWVFEEMMGGGNFYFVRPSPQSTHIFRSSKGPSTEDYEELSHRSHAEQLAAQERRKQESIARKERQAREREQECLEAQKRQKAKNQTKRAKAEAERKSSEERAQALRKKSQEIRSAVFTAARKGDAERVKKGIWEDAVDPSGGEVKPDSADFVKTSPEDPQETLLHIAITNDDLDLVKWLDSHSADPEERNSRGMTAFQLALQRGQLNIVNYFLSEYPPHDSDSAAIYNSSKCSDLLSLALESREPELVWIILDNKLASQQALTKAWKWASTDSGFKTLRGQASAKELEKAADIQKLLNRYGGFSSPEIQENSKAYISPKAANADQSKAASPEQPQSVKSTANNAPYVKQKQSSSGARGHGRGKGRGRGRGQFSRPNH